MSSQVDDVTFMSKLFLPRRSTSWLLWEVKGYEQAPINFILSWIIHLMHYINFGHQDFKEYYSRELNLNCWTSYLSWPAARAVPSTFSSHPSLIEVLLLVMLWYWVTVVILVFKSLFLTEQPAFSSGAAQISEPNSGMLEEGEVFLRRPLRLLLTWATLGRLVSRTQRETWTLQT